MKKHMAVSISRGLMILLLEFIIAILLHAEVLTVLILLFLLEAALIPVLNLAILLKIILL